MKKSAVGKDEPSKAAQKSGPKTTTAKKPAKKAAKGSASGEATGQPLYRQIELHLRAQIDSGAWQPGDLLPSVEHLRQQFGGVNHLTVRQAIGNLSKQKLVQSVPGRGTFVTATTPRARCIALILPHLQDSLTLRIAHGAQRVLETQGIQTLILDSRWDWNKEINNIRHLRDLPVDGAIIFPVHYGDSTEQIFKLKMEGFPFVLVDRTFHDIRIPAATVDNHGGSYAATRHLIERGRRRLAWIGDLATQHVTTSMQARLEGFRDALADGGLVYERALVRSIPFIEAPPSLDGTHAHPVREIIASLLQTSDKKPDGLVFGNDSLALSGLEALREMKVRVPQQIAVVGFDDVPEAARSVPPLTTVHQPMQRLGEEAARLMLARLQSRKSPPDDVVLPVELAIRQSS